MNERDQVQIRRLNRIMEGALTAVDGGEQSGLSERQIPPILAVYRIEGPAAFPHRNRGRRPGHTVVPKAL